MQVSIRETLLVVLVLAVAVLVTVLILSRDGAPPIDWRTDAGAPVTAGLTLHDGVLFAGTEAGELLAVDAADGRITWRVDVGSAPRGTLPVGEQHLYARTQDGRVVAVNRTTGAVAWTSASNRASTSPLLVDGTVFFATRDREVIALDAGSGADRWVARTVGTVEADLAVVRGQIAAGDIGGRLQLLDPASGRLLSEQSLGRQFAGPVLEIPSGYVAGPRPHVVSVGGDGRTVWQVETGEPTRLPMAVVRDLLIADASPDLMGADLTSGELRWRYSARALIVSFAVGERLGAAGLHTGEVHGIDLQTGERLWRFRTNEAIFALPVIDELAGRLYLGGRDQWLYALQIDGPEHMPQ